MQSIQKLISRTTFWFTNLSRRNKIAISTLSVVALAIILFFIFKKGTTLQAETADPLKQVEISSVSTLSNAGGPLSLTGLVKSQSEANIRTEASGQVTYVSYKIGDFVSADTVIAEIENSRERASLEQAKAVPKTYSLKHEAVQ